MPSCIPINENISIYEGDDCTLDFVSGLGDISNCTIHLQARVETSSRYSIIDVPGSITDASSGKYSVTFPSDSTLGHGESKPYFYDIKITTQQGSVHTDRYGMLGIEPRTTDVLPTHSVSIYGVDIDKDKVPMLSKARELNFEGSGVTVSTNLEGGVDIKIEKPATSPTLALHFAGIYDDLQALQDAIPKPTENMQAIVISPSEKYFHGVGGSWNELAPVGAMHPTYLGVYDSVSDLESANPSPATESMAIVGTTAKSFYLYDGSKWEALKHTDLPALDARLTDAEAKISKAQSDITGLQTVSGKNAADVAAIYAKTKAEFDSAVEGKLTQPKADISALQAGQGVLQSNINQKISGIHVEDVDNHSFDNIDGIVFDGAEVQDDHGTGTVHVVVKPKISVADGQDPDSKTLKGNAIVFKGAAISADPNDANVIIVGRVDTPKFDPSMFQSAIDHGYAADDQGVKSSKTTDGWWIFKDLSSVGGRPSDSVGELIVFRNNVDSSDPALKHSFVMAIGKNANLQSEVWFMYRDGTNWTPWFNVEGANQADIDRLSSSVDELKRANQAAIDELTKLQTAAGNLYAPTKDVFDKAVNALIQAALKNYAPLKPSHGGDNPSLVYPRIYAMFSNVIPTELASATTSENAEVTLSSRPSSPSRIFISVENDNNEASKVKGFKFNNNLEMTLNHRDIVIGGKKYRSFYTSGAFSEGGIDIKVDFGQGI